MKDLNKCLAEVFGTFILVFFGIGAAVISGGAVAELGISIAFGLGVIAAVYSIGHISGAHLNPAISLGAFLSGRMKSLEMVKYIISQIIGAILAVLVIFAILKLGYPDDYDIAIYGIGQNSFLEGQLFMALVFETVATFIFTMVVLGATSKKNTNTAFAGIVIGLTLTAIHIVGIPLTGVSVNPARSIAPAIFAGTESLTQLWVFIVAPLAGGAIAGLIHKFVDKAKTNTEV